MYYLLFELSIICQKSICLLPSRHSPSTRPSSGGACRRHPWWRHSFPARRSSSSWLLNSWKETVMSRGVTSHRHTWGSEFKEGLERTGCSWPPPAQGAAKFSAFPCQVAAKTIARRSGPSGPWRQRLPYKTFIGVIEQIASFANSSKIYLKSTEEGCIQTRPGQRS